MLGKTYTIFLDNKVIGTTQLELADPPMGVVFGKIIFTEIVSGYDFFRQYCLDNNIKMSSDYPDVRLVSTVAIPNLRVFNNNNIEIDGLGTSIEGMDSDHFYVTIIGIAYPFYEEEFPDHTERYNNREY